MAAGFVFCSAAAGGCRHCRPEATGTGHCPAAAAGGYRHCRPGSAGRSFPGNPGKPKNPRASIYGSRVRVLSGGSRWLSALPTRQRRQEFSGESRKTEEPGSFNLWLPGSCSVRRQQVAVGTADRRQQVTVGTAGRRQQVRAGSACPANPAHEAFPFDRRWGCGR